MMTGNTGRTWALPELNQMEVQGLASQMNISEAIVSVYLVRGLNSPGAIRAFRNPLELELHDPCLLPDMAIAVERICQALKRNERIFVVGDADCDGISSTALLVHALRSLGADVQYRIPNRLTDGFGIRPSDVELAKNSSASLVITVDNGTEGFLAAEQAKKLSIALIITDHHEPSADGALPNALAIVNPKRKDSKYPFSGLAGVGVAFKLVLALAEKLGCSDREAIIGELIQFVALGTVADMVPMLGENRRMVFRGCQELSVSSRPGIRALLNVAGIKQVESSSIGFYLAPMINASCRLGNPEFAVELLIEKREILAKAKARRLWELNEQRKTLQHELTTEILRSLPDSPTDPILFSAGENWHLGLLGLTANNLMNTYGRPVFVCSVQSNGTVRGSCRSQKSYSLDCIQKIQDEHGILTRLGGHDQAFGFELKSHNLDAFRELLNQYFGGLSEDQENYLEVDARLPWDEISLNTYQRIVELAPFGNGNPEPIFLSENLVVEQAIILGEGKHLKLMLSHGSSRKLVEAIWWRNGSELDHFPPGTKMDAVYKLGVNEFRGQKNMQLVVEDLQTA